MLKQNKEKQSTLQAVERKAKLYWKKVLEFFKSWYKEQGQPCLNLTYPFTLSQL